ncbi:MAG: hypothetical protein CUN55_09990 [Phototrophicales bacterium]|nr:MAG: hypothetical protein CUN55_09990 [Phototrophicales bacterium]
MNKSQQDHTSSLVLGTLIGFIIGGIAMLWNAPRSGQDTRQRIQNFFRIGIKQVQGETIDDSIEYGKMLAQQYRADHAKPIDE